MIGYVLEQELENRLPGRNVVTVLTQMVVDRRRPGVPGAVEADRARSTPRSRRATPARAERSWSIAPDNSHFRRVVASPQPLRIVELAAIRTLVDSGRARRLLGRRRHPRHARRARRAARHRGRDRQGPRGRAARPQPRRRLPADAHRRRRGHRRLGRPRPAADPARDRRPSCASTEFAAGSMGPKVEAACRFVEATGRHRRDRRRSKTRSRSSPARAGTTITAAQTGSG